MIFRLRAHRFRFRALERVYFPPGKAGNVLRGALGTAFDFARRPAGNGPSGLADPPRPFVLRAAHLDGSRFEPGEIFFVDAHVFDLHAPLLETFECVFSGLAEIGLGPRHGRVELIRPTETNTVELDLAATAETPRCVTVLFQSPTELKGNPTRTAIPFGILFARIRDRIATLRSLYGEGPLPIDFQALSRRANEVRTVACDLTWHDVRRRSSRTGAVHGIGGFTGRADYEGDLAEFLPYLRAAWWTGAGRYTVWGNGAIEVVTR